MGHTASCARGGHDLCVVCRADRGRDFQALGSLVVLPPTLIPRAGICIGSLKRRGLRIDRDARRQPTDYRLGRPAPDKSWNGHTAYHHFCVDGRCYLQLLGTYILSVSLHGLWNALAILFTFSALADIADTPNVLAGKQLPLSITMGVLALLFLVSLVLSNRRMVNSLPKPILDEPLL